MRVAPISVARLQEVPILRSKRSRTKAMPSRIIAGRYFRGRIRLTGETSDDCCMRMRRQQSLYSGSNRSGAAAHQFR
jgi:hypothetical protein